MPYTLLTDAGGDLRNAAALAAASQFAYFPQDQGAAAFKNELGMDGKLLSVNNTQAYVAVNDEHLVVAFRGSEGPTAIDGLKDWFMTNAMNFLIQPTGPLSTEFLAAGVGARWHQGFVNAISDIWEPLFHEVDARLNEKERTFWMTGHSLGGALATLGSWLFFRRNMMPHQVYTYGAPMVGNKIVAETYDREFDGKIFRYVNAPDPVPLLPMMSMMANEFVHVGGKGVLLGGEEQAANLFAYIKEKVMAHLLDDYRKLLG